MPKDFESRALFLSFDSSDHSLEHLGTTIDLFDDQSIMIIDLGGHAKGQIGALLNTPKKTLLVSDAAWLRENYERYQLPSPIVRVFFDSWKDYKKNLYKIHTYHKANPNTEIIPCHCEQTLKEMT
jgi:glyoxylase-like metal-dependent hydrolase (beta-lactamase superfamily II)